jgi:beta-phosphoglucomutase-like phosphatase (HAD superfamily)
VAFEDSATGVRSAVAAGLYTVACPGPLTTTHDLSPADLVVDTLEHVTLDDLAGTMNLRVPRA